MALTLDQFGFLGRSWSLWPPHETQRDGLNLVGAVRRVTSDIFSVCLIRKGEDPIHPQLGIAPDLFEPLSNYSPQYFIYNLREEILKWVPDIAQLYVDVVEFEDYRNRLTVVIQFTPVFSPTPHTVTFDFYAYQGALWNQGVEALLQGIQLDGEPFSLTA